MSRVDKNWKNVTLKTVILCKKKYKIMHEYFAVNVNKNVACLKKRQINKPDNITFAISSTMTS